MNRRKIELDFSTCWGTTNFTRVAGWIMWGLRDHFDQKSRFDIKLGNGVVDNIQRVGRREADLGIITPTANLNLAREGRGPFTTAYPDLVVLGRLGHDDRLTCAAASHVKIKSLHDVVSRECLCPHIGRCSQKCGSTHTALKQLAPTGGFNVLHDVFPDILNCGSNWLRG